MALMAEVILPAAEAFARRQPHRLGIFPGAAKRFFRNGGGCYDDSRQCATFAVPCSIVDVSGGFQSGSFLVRLPPRRPSSASRSLGDGFSDTSHESRSRAWEYS